MSARELSPWDFHDYQNDGVRHMMEHPASMFWLDVGLGKTSISLTGILERLERCLSPGTLVIAPKRVCRMVWRQEAKKWTHTRGLTFQLVQGNRQQRHYALRRPADVHLVNYENLQWLVDELNAVWLSRGQYFPWTTVVYDEVDKLKDSTSKRSRAMQEILPYFRYRIGLTGTPASEGYMDLFGQYLVVDGGQRLGTSLTGYQKKFFRQDGFKWRPLPGAEEQIKALIGDITFQMSARFTPDPIINDVYVDLPPKARAAYDRLEKEFFLEFDSGVTVDLDNEGSLLNKCLQAANGQPYVEPGSGRWEKLHDAKLDALADIVSESNGQPILVGYQFRSDLARIQERFPEAVYLGGNLSEAEECDIQQRWDEGRINILVGHPASMGHGLNLQRGGHIAVWFGLNWSRRLYLQFIGRLDRQGQEHTVVIHRLLARDTADEIQRLTLASKEEAETDLKETISQYRGGRS